MEINVVAAALGINKSNMDAAADSVAMEAWECAVSDKVEEEAHSARMSKRSRGGRVNVRPSSFSTRMATVATG